MHGTFYKAIIGGAAAALLSACATRPSPPPAPPAAPKPAPISRPAPAAPDLELGAALEPARPNPVPLNPVIKPAFIDSGFSKLKFWKNANPAPALLAFKKTCRNWKRRSADDWLHPKSKQYGQIKDWMGACTAAKSLSKQEILASRALAIGFFQTHFEPVKISGIGVKEGLLTGYYAPEIPVRRAPDAVFSEPVLAVPKTAKTQKLARKDLNAKSSKVLAYGRPIDVFFMHVQGSGYMRFKDGSIELAKFAAHNSRTFVPIGRLLIERGAMTKDTASKQNIEKWMRGNGPAAAQSLMNENPRYIFFKVENTKEEQGPTGGMGAILTGMGSMAVDTGHHPYGALVWLDVKLPQSGKDYIGQQTGLLVNIQDTGGAIKGPMRGDLYFGEGDGPGARAGVMKHKARWTLLLPAALAVRAQTRS